MTALIIYLLIGAGLFLFLLVVARRKSTPVGCGEEFVQARHALRTLQLGLLPANLVERIFDRGDLAYVTAEGPREICELFLAERKRISLIWVGRVRDEIRNLMRFHLGYSRFQSKLSLPIELRLTLDFILLLLACRTLQLWLYLRGPYSAPAIVGITAEAAARVCRISEQSLAFLNPVTGDSFQNDSTTGGAAV